MDSSKVAAICLVILSVTMVTESCMCEYQPAKDLLCSADFVVKGNASNWRLTEPDGGPPRSQYTITIIEAYKMPSGFEDETTITVFSIASDGLCGINPVNDNSPPVVGPIILSGNKDADNTLYSELCDHLLLWPGYMRDEQREALDSLTTPGYCS